MPKHGSTRWKSGNSFMVRCPTRITPQHTPLTDPPPRLLIGQDKWFWIWPGGVKGEFCPLHHSRFNRFPVAAGSLPLLLRRACAGTVSAGKGELGRSWDWETQGGEQHSKFRRAKWSVNSSSAAVAGSALGRSATSTRVSKQNTQPPRTPKPLQ